MVQVELNSDLGCSEKKHPNFSESCISCGACTRVCGFLSSLDMDLNIYEMKHKHSHGLCMLCGECKRVCPKEIDGRDITKYIRQDSKKSGTLVLKPYRPLLAEKLDYMFKNYSSGKGEVIFFPGCNLPSFLPDTMESTYKILKDNFNAGIVFDCCSKPIAEIGMYEESQDYIKNMNSKFVAMGAKELVTACPNCYYFLKNKLSIKVLTIYEKLAQIENFEFVSIKNEEIHVFIPCPDKDTHDMLNHIEVIIGKKIPVKNIIQDVQCCGLGGMAASLDSSLPEKMVEQVKKVTGSNTYTYCATCYGNFKRNNLSGTMHFLSELLGVEESFPKGIKSVINRAKYKFKTLK